MLLKQTRPSGPPRSWGCLGGRGVATLRSYRPDDAPLLLALFRDTIRRVNSRDYSLAQIAAWASDDIDTEACATRRHGPDGLLGRHRFRIGELLTSLRRENMMRLFSITCAGTLTLLGAAMAGIESGDKAPNRQQRLTNAVGMMLALIPAGEFLM